MGNILIIRYVEENVLWEKIVNEIFRSKNEGYVQRISDFGLKVLWFIGKSKGIGQSIN